MRKFKYTVEFDKFTDSWCVKWQGKIVKSFSADEQSEAHKWVQQAMEDERHPNY